MKCYLLPIGGTGVRIMKSVVQLCVAGYFDNIQFKVMCIDSDDVNGDTKELEDMISTYKGSNIGLFPKMDLAKIDGKERCIWSPLSGDRYKDKRSSMNDMVRESKLSDDAKKILNYLYTKEEREKVLEGGFYGHTSIGSFFMGQEIVKSGVYTDVWRDFFDDRNADDKVFILGSVFGGTGASGVPTIARLIHDNSDTADMPIGALFAMPYFKPALHDDEDSELPIDWTTFTTKTKTALSFYFDQEFDKIFDTMYFIGENSDDFMPVAYNDSGEKQQNKPNPIELFAATAVLDFVKSSKETPGFSTKFLSREETGELNKEMLNEIAGGNCFDKMSKFLKFAIMYTKYFHPCIMQGFAAEKWHKDYNISTADADNLYKICCNYITWVKKLIVDNDSDGRINDKAENQKLKWFSCKNCIDMYNGEHIKDHHPEGLFSKHEVYNLDELNGLMYIIKGETTEPGGDIIRKFANDVAPHSKRNKDDELSRFIKDVIGIC